MCRLVEIEGVLICLEVGYVLVVVEYVVCIMELDEVVVVMMFFLGDKDIDIFW